MSVERWVVVVFVEMVVLINLIDQQGRRKPAVCDDGRASVFV